MNKQELLSLANKGKVDINGFPLEVIVRPCVSFGDPWIDIIVEPLSPLHLPLVLGGKWVEYITDEECAELPAALEEYKRKADEFCESAKTVVKAELNDDGTYTFTDVPDSVKESYKEYPSALKRWLKQKHHIHIIGKEKTEWKAPGTFTLELNGVRYVPHWSYWLDCAYYKVDDQIKTILEKQEIQHEQI